MRKGIALSTEAAAICGGDDADPILRQLQHFGERPVQIVRVLRAGPERELAVMAELRHAGVLLHC